MCETGGCGCLKRRFCYGVFAMVMISNFIDCVMGDNFFLFLIKSLAAFGVYYFVCSLLHKT